MYEIYITQNQILGGSGPKTQMKLGWMTGVIKLSKTKDENKERRINMHLTKICIISYRYFVIFIKKARETSISCYVLLFLSHIQSAKWMQRNDYIKFGLSVSFFESWRILCESGKNIKNIHLKNKKITNPEGCCGWPNRYNTRQSKQDYINVTTTRSNMVQPLGNLYETETKKSSDVIHIQKN